MPKYRVARHDFTGTIIEILKHHYGEYADDIFESSSILGYLNNKTKGANRGSKSRGAFANHYALYVVIEDYIEKCFFENKSKIPYSHSVIQIMITLALDTNKRLSDNLAHGLEKNNTRTNDRWLISRRYSRKVQHWAKLHIWSFERIKKAT